MKVRRDLLAVRVVAGLGDQQRGLVEPGQADRDVERTTADKLFAPAVVAGDDVDQGLAHDDDHGAPQCSKSTSA